MKKAVWFVVMTTIAAAALLSGVRTAKAVPEFRKAFVTKYVKADSDSAKDKAFARAVDKARCNLCHLGTDKSIRNSYGKALAAHLTEDDQENTEKIRASLDKVASERSNPDDPKSPTFGELISSGKLPGDVAK